MGVLLRTNDLRKGDSMFSVIRRRLCYANVVATLALVFAMSGGALAAGHYLLTSTSQVSPKVLKALKGKNGAPGPAGAAGTQGPKGETGATATAGATGAKGEPGPKGEPGTPGAPGAAGKEGSPWTAGGTLPSGKSETGAWTDAGAPETIDTSKMVLASFAIPLPAPPTIYVIGIEEGQGEAKENKRAKKGNEERKLKGEPELPLTIPADCNGNVTKPGAASGDLCVFVKSEENVNVIGLGLPEGKLITTAGVVTNLSSSENSGSEFSIEGTWAVTAS
jgi:hypothetical protein